ncbi:MAG: AarF/UbiB family protein [Methanolinea sp.]|jgi:ubiquinone biosynthesis protein|nr:AarF/UbiB family protein [Methanolinea sp.]
MVTKFRRYWQIADILFKYGFGIVVQRLFPGVHKFRLSRTSPVESAASEYQRMRMALEELGPTYVKFGQIISTRQDMLPPGLVEELKLLQDHTNPLPFKVISEAIRNSCPAFDECFSEIEEEPLASASIAQVHRARLKDGTPVALKVQRPGIEEVIETDIMILESFARRAERSVPEWRIYNPRGIIKDFSAQIRKELDFARDGKNADLLRVHMRELDGVKVPKIFWEYSSRRLLVMEFIEGVRADNVPAIRALGVNPKKIAQIGFFAYMTQIFEHGFFHGDPHPGNLLVTREGTLVFLDFGIIGIIRPERRFWFVQLLNAIILQDAGMMLKSLEGLSVKIPEESREILRDEIYIAMLEAEGTSIGQYNFTMMTNSFTTILREYRIQVPGNLMLMLKVIIMVLDVGVTLDPGFRFKEESERFMVRFSKRESLVDQIMSRAGGSMLEAMDGFLDMPRNVNQMLKQLGTGTIKIDIVDTDIRRLQMALDRTSNKVLIGLIVSGMVVGSSFILREAQLPLPELVYYLAVFAYIIAIGIGFYAIYKVLSTGGDGGVH